MAEIDQNRYDQLIRRVIASVGTGSHVAESLSELFPVIDVELVPGELLLLGGTIPGVGAARLTGAAGEFPQIQLFNPADSGKLVTLSTVVVSHDATNALLRFGFSITQLTGAQLTERSRDSRVPFATRTVARVRSESRVAVTLTTTQIATLANSPLTLNDQNGVAILAPGIGFGVEVGVPAAAIQVSFFWRERVAEQAELQF